MFKRLLKNEKGITLVELLAVVVILGIIALIAVPAIANVIEDSRYDSVKATGINIIEAADLYAITNNISDDDVDLEDLVDGNYLDGDLSDWEELEADQGVFVKINSDDENELTGKGTDGNVYVEFDGASISEINDVSGSELRNDDTDNDAPVRQGSE
ncbi:type IV pilin protein [Alkalibacillus aidingensis]|uniref:type IV pilin protein n=1 Tax=Alkalibacillus aidingensis TaxID=2747607 RepID=UPI0016617CBA|nr:prepilin-type N-terminal cleavage/methylation domain-containing protein [Alkalibacillus aidingensis]